MNETIVIEISFVRAMVGLVLVFLSGYVWRIITECRINRKRRHL